MGEYFKPWRRKIGVMTLALACVLLVVWMRSHLTINRFTMKVDNYKYNRLFSFQGRFAWLQVVPIDRSNWPKQIEEYTPVLFRDKAEVVTEFLVSQILNNDDQFQWTHRVPGFEIGRWSEQGSQVAVQITIWKLSYWLLITPLTLISTWLLLSKPRLRVKKPAVNVQVPG